MTDYGPCSSLCPCQYGDTISNIVVVQFSQDIQTLQDMKYNLTCTTRGPGSAVVTSGYLGTA
jgi:hypothetical protein